MKVLFIGGYGNISWWCTKRAIEKGYDVYLLNREQTTKTRREIPKEANVIIADYRNFEQTKAVLKKYNFDVVCDFICYNAEQAKNAIELFRDKTKQYIVISTDSVCKTPDKDGYFRETSLKYQKGEGGDYTNGKLEVEETFQNAYKKEEFPVTIARPAYTYDTIMPYSIGHNCFTAVQRCLDGKPLLILGDGENKWTFTHSRDFANMFVELFGKRECLGEIYQIAGDCVETYNNIMKKILFRLGIKKIKVINIPLSEFMKHEEFSPKDECHRAQNRVFDNSKIKNIARNLEPCITVDDGVNLTIDWLMEKPERRRIVKALDEKLETLTNEFRNTAKEIEING